MKVVEIGEAFGLENLRVVERPEPVPGPRQVLLKMRAASLNYRDLLVVKGLYNPRFRLPLVPVSDGVGEVTAVGEGVTRVAVGDRVATTVIQEWVDGELDDRRSRTGLGGQLDGVLQEYMVLHEDGVIPVPEHLTDEEAATLPCAAVTAWNALFEAEHLKPGETVLAQGTGGVSLFALQFARLAGARVIVTSSSDAKLARAAELGAHEGINYRSAPEWERAARELTGGIGVDQVIEVGGAGTLEKSLRAVRTGGRISMIGILAGGAGEVNAVPVLMRNLRVQGIFVGSRAMFERMNRAVTLHRLRPVVDRVFPFTEVRAALEYMERGAHIGKIGLRFSE